MASLALSQILVLFRDEDFHTVYCIYSYELSIPVMLKTPFYGPVGTLIA